MKAKIRVTAKSPFIQMMIDEQRKAGNVLTDFIAALDNGGCYEGEAEVLRIFIIDGKMEIHEAGEVFNVEVLAEL